MNLTPPEMTYRLNKGSKLTWLEADNNWRGLLDFIKGLVASVDPVLNSNGTLKLFHEDTGTADSYAITPEGYLNTYSDGIVYLIRAANTNQGASTLKVASGVGTWLAALPIRKNGNSELVSGDITAGGVFMVVIRDGVAEFVSGGLGTGGGSGEPSGSSNGNPVFTSYAPVDVAVPTTVAASYVHTLGVVPTHVMVSLINVIAQHDYVPGDIVPIDEFVVDAVSGRPAFAVRFDEDSIDVVPNTALAYVVDLTDQAFKVITPANWMLRVVAFSYSGSDRFVSDQTDLAGFGTTATFNHGLARVPSVQVSLVSLATETATDSNIGDNVPLSSFSDADGKPAFAVRVTGSQVQVTQSVDQPYLGLPVVLTGSTHISTTIDGISSTADLRVGMTVTAAGIPFGATIISIAASSVVISAPGTATATLPITYGPQITQANWKLKVTAWLNVSPGGSLSAAGGITLAGPDAAVGYGSKLWLFHYGRFSTRSHISQLDLITNNVIRMASGSVDPNTSSPAHQSQVNASIFRYDSNDMLLWCSNKGAFSIPLGDTVLGETVITQYGGVVDRHGRKVIWYNEPGGLPELYLVASLFSATAPITDPFVLAGAALNGISIPVAGTPTAGFGIAGVALYRYKNTSGSTWVQSSLGPGGGTLNNLNLRSGTIVNIAEFINYHPTDSCFVLFQYNQIKKRIYVITCETGLVHIFNISLYTASNDIAAWWEQADAVRYPQLTYEKSLSLAGFGTGQGNASRETYTVEFDLITGAEQSICFTRVDNSNLLGSVTRVQWREG